MNTFTEAYVRCALWSSTNGDGTPLDADHSVEDIDPGTMQHMIDDCEKFCTGFARHWDDDARAGHHFWLTRNRHGAGFWDGDYSDTVGTLLTDAAHAFGEFDLYVGDDGLIYGGTS